MVYFYYADLCRKKMSSLYPRTRPNQKCRCGSQEKYKFCCKNKDMVDKLAAMYKHKYPDEDYELMALRKMFPTHGFRRPRKDERGFGTGALFSWKLPIEN